MARHGSLRTRILVILIAAAVIPTALVGILATWRARSDLEREVVRGNLALIRSLGDTLDRTLQGARSSLAVASSTWADLADDPDGARVSRRLLRKLRREVPLISALAIVDRDGNLLHGDTMPVPDDLGAHSFGGYIGDVVFEDGKPRVLMVTQARDRTGELVGALVAQLDLAFISEALGDARLGRGARLLVVDGDGVPVARSGGDARLGERSLRGHLPAVSRALGQATEGSMSSDDEVIVYRNLVGFQSLRGVRWAILLMQPKDEAYALARATTRDTLWVGAGVLIVLLAVGALLANRVTGPLQKLASRADEVAGGGAQPEEPIEGPGEIGLLANRLEEMAERISEREQLQGALARGDRLATVGTMAASVAHEVNNPLTTVLGYANLLLEDKDPDHPDRRGLELIASESTRMQAIVGNLLDYARGQREMVATSSDIRAVLQHSVDLLRPTARRTRVELALEIDGALPAVNAGADTLQQVFVNLVQNAIQAMPDGGRVIVSARLGPGKTAVEVTVTDRGPGIAPADRHRVFDSFYTTKERGAGTGLGLAVCRHLVSGFRGAIEVIDPPDGHGGACFRVRVPRSTGDA